MSRIIQVRSRAGNGVAAPWMVGTDESMIPADVRHEVELYFAERGRKARVGWNSLMKCAVIDVDLMPNDPRLKAWKEGRLRHEPKESVPLHYQPSAGGPFVAMDLHQLGASGIRSMLEKADTWSGTGEYASMLEAVRAVEQQNERLREEVRKAASQNSRDRARDMRRQVLGLPFVSVPENIGEANGQGTD